MKKITLTLILALIISGTNLFAQKTTSSGGYGHTLNLGLGIGYYGYYHHAGRSLPVLNINYEFDVARNFTLAPFLTFYTYRNDDAHYRESIIPVGVKGSYYFDQALHAGSDWDFYLGGSLGFAIRNSTWDDGYSGDTNYQDVSPLFLDLHLGTEYHLSSRVGLFLDLSTGVSTLGLAFR
ncbi:MAG: hypothetical protein ACOYN4_10520 [Bacteroidales bacterium]